MWKHVPSHVSSSSSLSEILVFWIRSTTPFFVHLSMGYVYIMAYFKGLWLEILQAMQEMGYELKCHRLKPNKIVQL